ncbi:MAG: carbamoyl-phosphate synthase (glutamine-hydrolyzing) large subunit [Candidatus Micrarchaeia archaeon]
MPDKKIKKVIVLGSGPIKIAEAAEFDYSGSQALKALREEGIESILINPNVATVQTSYDMADKIYLLPVSTPFIKKVIEKERPDGIMIGFGGQTALNAGIDLYRSGILNRYGIRVLGTSIEGVERALSREKFKETMEKCGIETPPSGAAKNREEALYYADLIGYPLMVRVSYNLGGRGSAVVWSKAELERELSIAFSSSKTEEILLERYLSGWKEIEYEVVMDRFGNSAVTACIENMDPMGVHTGESTVVTPAQTLDNYEYQKMRSTAIEVAKAIGLVGECNVQFALDPKSYRYYVIETNPRMSRSSALASKATGYPLAYVSAKLALGYRLYDIKNRVSGATTACFEPSLDYITVKIPRWDLAKFDNAKESIGTEMKSIGEVMGIGRNIEEALQKAVRMLDIGEPGIVGGKIYNSSMSKEDIIAALKSRKPYWFLYAAKAFKEGMSVDEVYNATLVDRFFLEKIRGIVERYENRGNEDIDALKKLGFSDEQLHAKHSATPSIKQIDTLAGEYKAATSYLYTTYNGSDDDIEIGSGGNKLLIVGAGVFRIGVSVEFDWSSFNLHNAAKKYFDEVALINYNPETVSTDWDQVGKLYFEELTAETIEKIYRKERFSSVATFAAGQIGNNLSKTLEFAGLNLFGTNGSSVDVAEDRNKFSRLVEKLGLKQPAWVAATSMKEIKRFISENGFPVLVRPSYVIGGSSMRIIRNFKSLMRFIENYKLSKYPLVISKIISGTEAELDCASDGSNVLGVGAQHIEEAGVHSGDATVVTPFFGSKGAYEKMKAAAVSIASELDIKGVFNIQFIISRNEPYIIELNLRASRSMPFSSKSVGTNLIEYGVKGIFEKYGWNGFYEPKHNAYMVKTPQFAWGSLRGAYPYLGPEMRSTGESASMDMSMGAALIKSWLGASPNRIPEKAVLVYGKTNLEYLNYIPHILSKYNRIVTLEDAEVNGAEPLDKNSIIELLGRKEIDLLITDNDIRDIDYEIRRAAADLSIPMVLNGRLGKELAMRFHGAKMSYNELSSYY